MKGHDDRKWMKALMKRNMMIYRLIRFQIMFFSPLSISR